MEQAAEGSSNERSTDQKSSTPLKDAYFARLEEVTRRCNALGQILIVGIEPDNDEGKEGSEEGEEYTEEQLSKLCFTLVDSARENRLKDAEKIATGGQQDDRIRMYNTTHGNNIIFGLPKEIEKATRKKTKPEKFNVLFALTYELKDNDYWMFDNEMWGKGGKLDAAITKLARAWKTFVAEYK